ncbi:MAG TPA: GDSL-type esterase/lipase family protein, partial [Patescibacteria group bacterium]|nr:GDSL-type esterase/lipase family protein [Patescibacteria group bacterium]
RVRYVALGDSYTIGTAVAEAERWPNQLAGRIGGIELVANLGVNDVVQGVPDANYAVNVALILDDLVGRLARDRIVCVATPDYTRTPRGAEYGDPDLQSDRIVRINAILREACEQRRITFVPEIFEISLRAGDDPALVAEDGLHPSGEQYRRWVEAIAPVVEVLLAG